MEEFRLLCKAVFISSICVLKCDAIKIPWTANLLDLSREKNSRSVHPCTHMHTQVANVFCP